MDKGYTSRHFIGRGAETENYRLPGSDFVVRVFKDSDKESYRTRPVDGRTDAVVQAGILGISPPARKISESIVEQQYVDFDDGELKGSLKGGDYPATWRTVKALKKAHDRGIYLRDPATINLADPKKTGGFVTVDSSQFGFIPEGREKEYVLGDLAKTYRDADSIGRGGLLLSAVRDIYDDSIVDDLVGIRSRERRTGEKVEPLPLTPFEYRQKRRAA